MRNSGGGTDTTVYIDGVFEHRFNSASDEQNLIHVGGVATVRIGDNFGDDVYNSSLTQDACYKLSNHLGSVSFRTRSSGSKVDIEEYYPFGDSSLRTWASKKYRYVGKEKDQESGLYFYGARYYAAWTCRFISTDPLARDYPHLTSYNYASNAPINHLDVDGMQSDGDETIPDAGPSKHAKGNYNAETGIYTVVSGYWLSAIALRFGLTPNDVSGIAGLNGIEDPDEIKVGDTILIPMKVPDDVSNASSVNELESAITEIVAEILPIENFNDNTDEHKTLEGPHILSTLSFEIVVGGEVKGKKAGVTAEAYVPLFEVETLMNFSETIVNVKIFNPSDFDIKVKIGGEYRRVKAEANFTFSGSTMDLQELKLKGGVGPIMLVVQPNEEPSFEVTLFNEKLEYMTMKGYKIRVRETVKIVELSVVTIPMSARDFQHSYGQIAKQIAERINRREVEKREREKSNFVKLKNKFWKN